MSSAPRNGRLLDLGSSDGGTLRHFAELRPDLSFAAADIAGAPEAYPPGTDFAMVDFERDALPWAADSFDAVTCMHVVEHLDDPAHLLREAARVLKSGGRLYVETPHPKSVSVRSVTSRGAEHVTLNFYDDATHVRPVPVDKLVNIAHQIGLSPVESGTSRNWLFAGVYPLLRVFRPHTRARYVAQLHWTGWSSFLIARLATETVQSLEIRV